MPFIALLLSLVSISAFAASMDKEFNCYTAMNSSTRAENFVLGGEAAIHPIDDFSFFKVTRTSVQKCRVPARAALAPGGKAGAGPWLLELSQNKSLHHFQYPRVQTDPKVKGSPKWRKPECTAVAAPEVMAEILENRIADSRQNCHDGPELPDCLSEFLSRLSSCEGIPVVREYVRQIGQSAAVHARPAPANTEEKPGINR